MTRSRSSVALALFAASPSAFAGGAVWVVDDDGGPGVDFTEIVDAVGAAAPGDTILVKDGSYAKVFIEKPLAVVAEVGATPTADGIRIADIGALELVVLRGISSLSSDFGIEVKDCEGTVWLEDGSFESTSANPVNQQAALVDRCNEVTFLRCSLQGGSGTPWGLEYTIGTGHIRSGLHAIDSEVHVFESESRGGFPSGSGAFFELGSLYSSDSFFKGNNGAGCIEGPFAEDAPGLDGGRGLFLGGSASSHAVGSTFEGGLGGPGGCSAAGGGSPGAPIQPSEKHTDLPGEPRSLEASAPVREGGSVVLTAKGQPGDAVLIGISLKPTGDLFLPLYGPLLVAPPHLVVTAGAIPAGGTLVTSLPIGLLGPGTESLVAFAQGLFLAGPEGYRLGSGTAAVLLDGTL